MEGNILTGSAADIDVPPPERGLVSGRGKIREKEHLAFRASVDVRVSYSKPGKPLNRTGFNFMVGNRVFS